MLSKIAPTAGKILISEPFMLDPQFRRSVVLLVEHAEQGSVGFVLNQETQVTIPDIIPGFPMFDARIYIGGPVQTDTLHFIHKIPTLIEGGVEIEEGIYWGGDFEQLKSIIDLGGVGTNQIKFFLGYSGWSPGQLDAEIAENSWLVAESDIQLIMNGDKDLWLESVKNAGGHYKTWKNFPKDPKLN